MPGRFLNETFMAELKAAKEILIQGQAVLALSNEDALYWKGSVMKVYDDTIKIAYEPAKDVVCSQLKNWIEMLYL